MPVLSENQVNVLRKVVKDASFRQAFTTNPQQAVKQAGIQLSPQELQQLSKVTPQVVSQIQAGVKSAKAMDADGTHTLLYAIAAAALIA